MKKRILVVDDAATIRLHIVSILEAEYDCVIAPDGKQALQEALREPVAAIITDLEMPEMNGLELLRAIRTDPRTVDVPVVVVTTVSEIGTVNQCRTLGCAGFVLKPVQGDYLLAKLRQILSKPKKKPPTRTVAAP